MKENLNKIILSSLIIEISIFLGILPIDFKYKFEFLIYWGWAIVILNILAIIILFIYKPKGYLSTVLFAFITILTPFIILFFAISSMGC